MKPGAGVDHGNALAGVGVLLVHDHDAGGDTGKLDHVLEKVSVYYDSEVETPLKATTSLIEPIMISVMGLVVGTIGLALMLPIFSLSKQP